MSITPEGGWSESPQQERRDLMTARLGRPSAMHVSERWIVGLLLLVALLTFFFPLAAVQLPILGNQEMSGYDLIAKGREFNRELTALKPQSIDQGISAPTQSEPNESDAAVSHSSMPLSFQLISLIPIEIILSFGCAAVALLCCLGSFGLAPTKTFCSFGAIASIAALLHLVIANSDMHTWFREQMMARQPALVNNPFAGIAQQIETLAVNSVQLKPGSGLFVEVAALSLAAVMLLSRVLSSSPSMEAVAEPYASQDNGHRRTFGLILLLFAMVAAGVVIIHYVATPPLQPNAFTGEFSASKAFTFLFGNYDAASKSASVSVSDQASQQSRGTSTLILDKSFAQGGEQKHLIVVSTATAGEDCHACDAGIGAYLFVRRGDGWVAEIEDKEIARFGAFGTAGKARAIEFGPGLYGFSITLEDGHQGETDASELFAAPVGSHFRPVLSLGIESDNLGDCGSTDPDMILGHDPCVQSKSAIRFLKTVHQGFFDIAVDESGTKNTDSGVVPTNSKTTYIFSEDKYIQQQTAPIP
ncbi:MAG TPA: hypothetical protein VFC39_22650 [Acidobacteriaceae bacterium]|nr:hypothetical protein [Acidobacteriaceae bacterium]